MDKLSPVRCEHKVGKGQCTKPGKHRIWLARSAKRQRFAALCSCHFTRVNKWQKEQEDARSATKVRKSVPLASNRLQAVSRAS